MSNKDLAQRFIFDNADIRGEIISLEESLAASLAAHNYPVNVKALLGELVAAAVLLSSTLKFEGIMSLQAKGEGPLSLLMVECSDQRTFRALARWDEENTDKLTAKGLQGLLGNGQLIMTIDPHKGNRYQGIVPLHHETLAAGLNDYFKQSEQLATEFWLTSNGETATGMLLQALPVNLEKDEKVRAETWERISVLAKTVTEQEMLELDHHTLLTRLFHDESARLFDGEKVEFNCNCSRPRSAQIIQNLGQEEAESIVVEQGEISMGCQFCSQTYVFTGKDVADIFTGNEPRTH
ncbi:Hsp33 family molecular chaperone HslO [Endozoicomonas sp. OPT23]|uniref:Hsp33 family molecular chaperone HslO n=1 Tax=Endozoicomonas sp. OPT23 TaxID=2072845 RepID=UPI00129B314B|nr:Hsp33 family molecular chaperone HslO [Endozoicomonas sp. OPT23]MRI31561.1 Hsp33 family molecular chaperone HslO [Endozoicomonas sp. OPT23]